MARLLEKYKKEIVPELQKRLNLPNKLAIPQLEKIVVSMGVGKAVENKDRIPAAVKDLAVITGQQPVITTARKSVSGFKLREKQQIGCKVTLRGKMMYEFLDRLICIIIPRSRDFRGLNKNSFDQSGNFNMGIPEQIVFPEINIDEVKFVQGMDITIVIKNRATRSSASSTKGSTGRATQYSYELLKLFGMPFRS